MKSTALAAALSALIALPAVAADNVLFQAAPLTPLKTDRSFEAIAQEPSTGTVDVVLANAAIVDPATDALVLPLDIAGPVSLTARRLASRHNVDGTVVWEGSLADEAKGEHGPNDVDDAANGVILVRNGDKVTGSIRVHGQLYAVRPLADGRHAVIEVDESRMPPDHNEATYARQLNAARALPVAGSGKATTASSVIRVLVNYTDAVASASADVLGLVNLAVAESNKGYTNSGVGITLELAGTGKVTYTQKPSDISTDLTRYRGTSDGYMDSVHAQRDSAKADVGVLLVNPTDACGIAGLNVGASAAYAVVATNCATGYYSFAHEIGHLLGAHHDPAAATNNIYAYGHGYVTPSKAWRTIMAYPCQNTSAACTRLNYWSNPDKTYNALPMGTAAKSNNARVLNERAATVAAFR